MKRFYKNAGIQPVDGLFLVTLDGKPIRTPGGRKLALPVESLAAAIAEEWQLQPQQGDIVPKSMPLMRLAATGLDRVSVQRNKVIDDTARYAGSDLLCYRAAGPDDLVNRQYLAWQPILDWARQRYGVELQVQSGVMHRAQSPEALRTYHAEVARYSDLGLSGLFNLVAAAGSLVVGLAVSEQRLDAVAAYEAAEMDAIYQAERWGEDPEAAIRSAGIRHDIDAAARFLALLGPAKTLV